MLIKKNWGKIEASNSNFLANFEEKDVHFGDHSMNEFYVMESELSS